MPKKVKEIQLGRHTVEIHKGGIKINRGEEGLFHLEPVRKKETFQIIIPKKLVLDEFGGRETNLKELKGEIKWTVDDEQKVRRKVLEILSGVPDEERTDFLNDVLGTLKEDLAKTYPDTRNLKSKFKPVESLG